ncbi:MAG TPA: pentapeptide repeat-containing protein [Pedobacter sp.]|jgi:uncharacterized protein YjbI with pentapeptide repeats
METKMIGSKIAEARKKIGISQAQLAERLFISPQAVGKWERGESVPDIITFNRLAKILGVDLNYFSDNFEVRSAELAPVEGLVNLAIESPSAEQKGKLGWNMSGGNWVDADFSGLKNLYERFSGSNLQRCKFIDSDLSGLLLKGNHIERCDFRGSNISGSQIQRSEVTHNLFNDCSLKDAVFSGCHIEGCDFSGVDFSGASLKSCSFEKSVTKGTVLTSTSFIGSALSDIVFEGILEDCAFDNCSFSRVTFQNAKLTNTFFKSGGLKRLKFIDCHVDRMTFEFLKNGKADLSGVMLIAGD